MPSYDAASIVAQTAGLEDSRPDPVTPEQLVERYCTPEAAQGLRADPGTRTNAEGITISRGFCGYTGERGIEPFDGGFDDGWDFLGNLVAAGWESLPGRGEWPYIVYMQWALGRPEAEGTKEAIAQYCEGDLTVWQFESHEQAHAFCCRLRERP